MSSGVTAQDSERLEVLIRDRKTVGGYFDTRIESPHSVTGGEADFLIQARVYNQNLPDNLWLVPGDPSLEIQAQAINQIGGQVLPANAWQTVHNWLRDLVIGCTRKLGEDLTTVFIDCNPSFSAYTELAMIAADRVIIPCSSDGSSARAIDNVGSLLYGIATGKDYGAANFPAKATHFGMALPLIHSVLLNRSTQYSKRASKAFAAMFEEIKLRAVALKAAAPQRFVDGELAFADVPDSHSVAIVCSHLGLPLYEITPGQYDVYEETPQVNSEPLKRYKDAMAELMANL